MTEVTEKILLQPINFAQAKYKNKETRLSFKKSLSSSFHKRME